MLHIKIVFRSEMKQKICSKNFHFKIHFKNIDLLYGLPFYEELSTSKEYQKYLQEVIKLK